jgi:hypothetical protein
MKQFYMVMGDFDVVGICEAPDDAMMARYALQLGGLGFVRTKTLKAFPETGQRGNHSLVGLNLKADRSPSVRPVAFAQTSAASGRIEADLCALRPSWARPTTAAAPYGSYCCGRLPSP